MKESKCLTKTIFKIHQETSALILVSKQRKKLQKIEISKMMEEISQWEGNSKLLFNDLYRQKQQSFQIVVKNRTI